MRALLIRPTQVNITHPEVTVENPYIWLDLPDDSTARLDALQAIIGGPVEALPIPWKHMTFWSNEDAKGLELPTNSIATSICAPLIFPGDYIAGPVVVCGFHPPTGEDRSMLDQDTVEEFVQSFFGLIDDSAHRWAQDKEQA